MNKKASARDWFMKGCRVDLLNPESDEAIDAYKKSIVLDPYSHGDSQTAPERSRVSPEVAHQDPPSPQGLENLPRGTIRAQQDEIGVARECGNFGKP